MWKTPPEGIYLFYVLLQTPSLATTRARFLSTLVCEELADASTRTSTVVRIGV